MAAGNMRAAIRARRSCGVFPELEYRVETSLGSCAQPADMLRGWRHDIRRVVNEEGAPWSAVIRRHLAIVDILSIER